MRRGKERKDVTRAGAASGGRGAEGCGSEGLLERRAAGAKGCCSGSGRAGTESGGSGGRRARRWAAAAVEAECGGGRVRGGGGAPRLLSVRSIEEMYIEQIQAPAQKIAFTKKKPKPSHIAYITLI